MNYKQIFLVILAFLLGMFGYWFYHNRQARDIVEGAVKNPATYLRSDNFRTNILLLGIGGEGHSGSNLTDSMILISIDLNTFVPTLISIPRDIWVDSLAAKINTAYHYGEEKEKGSGLVASQSTVSEIVGLPVHYCVVLDFAGFTKAIDAVGGINLTIDNSFDDYKYPIPGLETAEPESARYEHLHFDAGPTHLDGATALKFVRSRHAEGDEGTDFARSSRQQKVISAFREKIFSTSTLLSLDALTALKNSVTSSIVTNISEIEYGSFVRLFLSLPRDINLSRLDFESQFITPKNLKLYGGQWVLIPAQSWENVHAYVKENLK